MKGAVSLPVNNGSFTMKQDWECSSSSLGVPQARTWTSQSLQFEKTFPSDLSFFKFPHFSFLLPWLLGTHFSIQHGILFQGLVGSFVTVGQHLLTFIISLKYILNRLDSTPISPGYYCSFDYFNINLHFLLRGRLRESLWNLIHSWKKWQSSVRWKQTQPRQKTLK